MFKQSKMSVSFTWVYKFSLAGMVTIILCWKMLQFYFYSISQRPHLLQFTYLKKKNQPTNQPKPNHKTNKKKKTRENIPKDHYAKFIKASLNVARGWLNASWMMFADVIS